MIKRRDKWGIMLRPGESQRSNGSYEYRYTVKSCRKSVYARTLDELRQKEAEIEAKIDRGIDVSRSDMTVSQLLDRYLRTKANLKDNSRKNYESRAAVIRESFIGSRRIDDVRVSEAKNWCQDLHKKGYKRETVSIFQQLLRSAFNFAIEDELLNKNPFQFSLARILPDDSEKRQALTPEEQERYLHFARLYGENTCYDEIVILLETGLRISELCGLTMADLDLDRHRLYVSKQLTRPDGIGFKIDEPKSKSGFRTIPLTPTACAAFRRVLENRRTPKVEMMVDGRSGFIFLTQRETPKRAYIIEAAMRRLEQKVLEKEGVRLPHVTPHVLRHTFCTNCIEKGIDIKSAQYIMGHARSQITLDIYAHANEDSVCEKFEAVFVS